MVGTRSVMILMMVTSDDTFTLMMTFADVTSSCTDDDIDAAANILVALING